MLNSQSIWVWRLIVPHMIVTPPPSTPTSPSADSTIWTLTPHHETLRYTSHSNRHSLTQNQLTATSLGLQINLSPISLVSVLPIRPCWCALQGAKWRYGVPTTQKLPLTRDNLITVFDAYQPHPSHDDLLFITQYLTGFDCLMCLGELTWPDSTHLCDYRKVTMWHSVE